MTASISGNAEPGQQRNDAPDQRGTSAPDSPQHGGRTAAPARPGQVGGQQRLIGRRYRLAAPLGRGAMGMVWRARDELLDRDVAIKEVRLPPSLSGAERDNGYQRTLREARTAARLAHPAVAAVYDVVEERGRPWIVMELVPGRSLEQVIGQDGPLPPARAADVGRQLLAALASAHAAGVLHRDVKPSNVLLTPAGRIVLTDFGIATMEGDPSLTQTGMVMGSPGFLAPERIRGGTATPASDLWSLGATLYAAVEGKGPYDRRGGAMTTMAAVVTEDPPPATAAGPLAPVIGALLSRDPAARPTAAAAARMLDAAAGGSWASAVVAGSSPGGAAPPGMPAGGAGARGIPPHWPATTRSAPREADTLADGRPGAVTVPDGPAGAFAAAGGPGGAFTLRGGPAEPAALAGGPRAAALAGGPATAALAGGPRAAALAGGPVGPGLSAAATPLGERSPTRAERHGVAHAAGPPTRVATPDPLPRLTRQDRQRHTRRPYRAAPAHRHLIVVLAIIGAAALFLAAAVAGAGLHRARSGIQRGTPSPLSRRGAGSGATTPGQARTGSLGALPAGFRWYSQPAGAAGPGTAGFRVAVPMGWHATRDGMRTVIAAPGGSRFLDLDLTPHHYVGMVAEALWLQQRTRRQGTFPGYRRNYIRPVLYRGTIAADWAFTWYSPSMGRQEVLDRMLIAQGPGASQSFALYWSVSALRWQASQRALHEAYATFQPVW